MEHQEKYANFSKASYKLFDPLKSKSVNQQNSLKSLNDVGITGFELHPSSSNRRGVFINDKTKEIVISHRGTNTSSKSNLVSDVAIGLGLQGITNRFKTAVRKDAKIKNSFPGYKITAVGHSLGGLLGTHSATQNKIKGVGYNIGSTLPTISQISPFQKKINKNITHYSVNFDPVSIGSKKYPIKQIRVPRKKGLNPHALENFV